MLRFMILATPGNQKGIVIIYAIIIIMLVDSYQRVVTIYRLNGKQGSSLAVESY